VALIVSQAVNDATGYEHGYGNHPLWAHIVVGLGTMGVPVAALVALLIWPGLWDRFEGKPSQRVDPAELSNILKGMVRSCRAAFSSACRRVQRLGDRSTQAACQM
jgi:hypothetical protein